MMAAPFEQRLALPWVSLDSEILRKVIRFWLFLLNEEERFDEHP